MKKSFFTNSNTLLLSAMFAEIFYLIAGVLAIEKSGNNLVALPHFLIAALLIILLISLKNGETNCQKATLGALIFYICADNLTVAVNGISSKDAVILKLIPFVLTALYFIVFINHLLLQSDHIGISLPEMVNKIVLAVLPVCIIAYMIALGAKANTKEYEWIYDIASLFAVLLIVCVEAKIQSYKKFRAESKQNGTWNEETRAKAKETFKI